MRSQLYLLLALACACAAAFQTNGGQYIAILASGDVSDLGYNDLVNLGRVAMEKNLNISGSLWVPDLVNQQMALDKIKQLVPLGYKLIVSSTGDHGQAAALGAALYPNVSFVQDGGSTTLPNLSVVSFSGADLYYAAGVFAGAMTTSNNIGFIHPGAPPLGPASWSTLNSFYVGAKTSNPNVNVYSVLTGSYLNPDRTIGASRILLDGYGCDMLAGQQDDFTLQEQSIEAGILAIGLNGMPLSNVYGQSVGMSVIRDWGQPLTIYAKAMLANLSGTIHQLAVTGSFANGYSYLDTPSYLVPDTVWNTTLNGVNLLKGKTKPYYCSPYVAELNLNTTTGCLVNTTVFGLVPLSEITIWGKYVVPLEEIELPRSIFYGVTVLAAILYVLTCIVSAAVYFLRRDTVMLASSPFFLGLVIVGCIMVYSAAIVWVIEPTVSSCHARIWVPSIGFTLAMGSLIIKNVRLWLIFDNALKRVRISNLKLLAYTGILLAGDVLLLALWTGFGSMHIDHQQNVNGLGLYQIRKFCATTELGDRFLYAIIAYHLAQLAVGCYVTFKIRIIDIEEFNESRPFGLSIYVVSLVCTIAGILIGTSGTTGNPDGTLTSQDIIDSIESEGNDQNPVQVIIIITFSFLIGASAVVFLLFAPKFLTIILKGERPIQKIMRKVTGRSGSSHSGTTASATAATVTATQVEPSKENTSPAV